MADTVKIKIAKLTTKVMPSKFKEGETYNMTTVLDEISGRKGTAMGAFADAWKVGDTVDGIWEKRTYKDKDGFDQESWNIKNPAPKVYGGQSGTWAPKKPTIVDAYTIAVALVPVFFKDKKVKLDDVARLADEVMKKLVATAPADAAKPAGKDVDLNKEEVSAPKQAAEPAEAPRNSDTAAAEDDDDDDF